MLKKIIAYLNQVKTTRKLHGHRLLKMQHPLIQMQSKCYGIGYHLCIQYILSRLVVRLLKIKAREDMSLVRCRKILSAER